MDMKLTSSFERLIFHCLEILQTWYQLDVDGNVQDNYHTFYMFHGSGQMLSVLIFVTLH